MKNVSVIEYLLVACLIGVVIIFLGDTLAQVISLSFTKILVNL